MSTRNKRLAERYSNEAEKLKNVIFLGRLAQYRHFNMDNVVEEALNIFISTIQKDLSP